MEVILLERVEKLGHIGDVVSVSRQARSANHAIETSIDELALQQEGRW